MKRFQQAGLGIYIMAFVVFISLLFLSKYEVTDANLDEIAPFVKEEHQSFVRPALAQLKGQEYGFKFSYLSQVKDALNAADQAIADEYGIPEAAQNQAIAIIEENTGDEFALTETTREKALEVIPEDLRQTIRDYTGWLIGRSFSSKEKFLENVTNGVQSAAQGAVGSRQLSSYDREEYLFQIAKYTAGGIYWDHPFAFFFLIFIVGTIGALVWIFPAFFDGMPGIKHNGIYHNSAMSRGIVGMGLGAFLVAFYLLLYFHHYYLAEWITLIDPISQILKGIPADRWFMYGFLYTISVLVMGIRMFTKYRHSAYHLVRTGSVMFFQTAFAFIFPQVLYRLKLPSLDLKNIWPLDYSFFFEYRLDELADNGTIGYWMLGWGIALFLIGVPAFTYFYGKRWYCSWVCGCGGLAETLGDPWRQLSDKSVKAWKFERIFIHSILVFAVIMTGTVLYTYFTESSTVLGIDSYKVRGAYGLYVSSWFAGVIGTGLYPLLGNRPWCRFACPLAAYLGLVQRFKSQFRITTNGGQCISCGNCSTYCEMGIDVRSYAQRGQNIVRSSCVGCGVCSAVCPRGVLSLENLSDSGETRTESAKY